MKKRLIILLQVLIATVLIGTSVYAAIDTTIVVSTLNNRVERGEEVSVTLSLENVEEGHSVTSVDGYINYNKNIFETVTVDNIVKDADDNVTIAGQKLVVQDLTNLTNEQAENTNWVDHSVIFNGNVSSKNNIKIVIDFEKNISQDTDLITIKFKVKENATLGEIKDAIKYELFNIDATNQEEVLGISKKIDITVVEKVVENKVNNTVDNKVNNTVDNKVNNTVDNKVNNTVDNKVNNTVDNKVNNTVDNKVNNTINNKVNNTVNNKVNNTVNNNNSNTKTNNTKDNTVASVLIPAAGANMIIIPAIILILCAYICYNRYMKYKEF